MSDIEYEPTINECMHCANPFTGDPGRLCHYCYEYTDGRAYSPQPEQYTCVICNTTKLAYFDGNCQMCQLGYYEMFTKEESIQKLYSTDFMYKLMTKFLTKEEKQIYNQTNKANSSPRLFLNFRLF